MQTRVGSAAEFAQPCSQGITMDWLTTTRIVELLLLAAGLAYLAVRLRRRGNTRGGISREVEFTPAIGFTRLDGGRSVAVLLENRSRERVWVEEVEIALTDLVADDQVSEAS